MSHDHTDHDHDHSHGHSQSGGHSHAHAPTDFGLAFKVGITLNLGFVICEATFGILSNSMALLADAGHNLSDVLGLMIAWGATILAKAKPGGRFTYGLRSSSIVAALINALVLLVAIVFIAIEAIKRFFEPSDVASGTVMIVAAIGIVINTITALMFMRGSKGDINIRGAFLHMAADAGVSAGVVVAGFFMLKTSLNWIDPVVSLAIVVIIGAGTWGLLRQAVDMSLHAIPAGIDAAAVSGFLSKADGVVELHDLHIWSMSTTETALTAHLVMPSGHPGDAFLAALARDLEEQFNIHHMTIQIETDATTACALRPADVV